MSNNPHVSWTCVRESSNDSLYYIFHSYSLFTVIKSLKSYELYNYKLTRVFDLLPWSGEWYCRVGTLTKGTHNQKKNLATSFHCINISAVRWHWTIRLSLFCDLTKLCSPRSLKKFSKEILGSYRLYGFLLSYAHFATILQVLAGVASIQALSNSIL